MLASLGVAALLGIVGTLAAVLWTVVLGLASAPGAALADVGARYGRRTLMSLGMLVSFLLESYLLLAFAALVIRVVQSFLTAHPSAPAWPLWLVGWYLATAPVLFGGHHADAGAGREANETAFTFALPAAALGFWVFVLWPQVVEWGWGWIPSLPL